MVVDWAKGEIKIEAPHIQHLLSAIRDLLETFESTYFTNIYRELNVEADKLSKEALLLPPGLMEVKEFTNNLLVNQYVRL